MMPGWLLSWGKESRSRIRSSRRVGSSTHWRGVWPGKCGDRLVEPGLFVFMHHVVEACGDSRIGGWVESLGGCG